MSAGATGHKRKALQVFIFSEVRLLAQFHDGINSGVHRFVLWTKHTGRDCVVNAIPMGEKRSWVTRNLLLFFDSTPMPET